MNASDGELCQWCMEPILDGECWCECEGCSRLVTDCTCA